MRNLWERIKRFWHGIDLKELNGWMQLECTTCRGPSWHQTVLYVDKRPVAWMCAKCLCMIHETPTPRGNGAVR